MPIKEPFLVGISGGSGSGKTYFLKLLMEHFKPEEISLISQDHYYLPLDRQVRDPQGQVNFDEPTGIDQEGLYRDICRLIRGEPVIKTEYSFNNPNIKPGLMEILPAPIIVVEGLFVFFFEEISRMLDYRVFISSDEAASLERRIRRDKLERALSEEQVRYQWQNHVRPAYHAYLLPYLDTCDYVIENSGQTLDLDPLFAAIESRRHQY